MERRGSLWRHRLARHCNNLRRAVCSPGQVAPGSRDPGSGGLHRLPRRGGVDSDLCLHTGFLLAAAAALAFHARLWSSFRQCSESCVLAHTETTVSCLLGSSRSFPGLPPG